jgi:hypothetical protein
MFLVFAKRMFIPCSFLYFLTFFCLFVVPAPLLAKFKKFNLKFGQGSPSNSFFAAPTPSSKNQFQILAWLSQAFSKRTEFALACNVYRN